MLDRHIPWVVPQGRIFANQKCQNLEIDSRS